MLRNSAMRSGSRSAESYTGGAIRAPAPGAANSAIGGSLEAVLRHPGAPETRRLRLASAAPKPPNPRSVVLPQRSMHASAIPFGVNVAGFLRSELGIGEA